MTGITKDELMQMAREAGFHSPKGGGELFSPYLEHVPMNDVVERFYNAILERAAVECKKVEDFYWCCDSAVGATACIQTLRALKINTGD